MNKNYKPQSSGQGPHTNIKATQKITSKYSCKEPQIGLTTTAAQSSGSGSVRAVTHCSNRGASPEDDREREAVWTLRSLPQPL